MTVLCWVTNGTLASGSGHYAMHLAEETRMTPFRIALAFAFLYPAAALSQAFPGKPIRIVVPFPPGGADITARQVAPKLQEDLGQPIVIENRAGANGLIGTEYVSKQPPDGYTLLWTANNPIVTGPVTTPNETHYDPNRDLTHIALVL